MTDWDEKKRLAEAAHTKVVDWSLTASLLSGLTCEAVRNFVAAFPPAVVLELLSKLDSNYRETEELLLALSSKQTRIDKLAHALSEAQGALGELESIYIARAALERIDAILKGKEQN